MQKKYFFFLIVPVLLYSSALLPLHTRLTNQERFACFTSGLLSPLQRIDDTECFKRIRTRGRLNNGGWFYEEEAGCKFYSHLGTTSRLGLLTILLNVKHPKMRAFNYSILFEAGCWVWRNIDLP